MRARLWSRPTSTATTGNADGDTIEDLMAAGPKRPGSTLAAAGSLTCPTDRYSYPDRPASAAWCLFVRRADRLLRASTQGRRIAEPPGIQSRREHHRGGGGPGGALARRSGAPRRAQPRGAARPRAVARIVGGLCGPRHRRPADQGDPAQRAVVVAQQLGDPERPWLDLAYQLVAIGFGVMPVLLALYLLRRVDPPVPYAATRFLGFDLSRPWADLGGGVALAAVIGIPGLGLYVAARALGINTQVAAANLTAQWWTIPVLVLSAVQNAALEEVVVVGTS